MGCNFMLRSYPNPIRRPKKFPVWCMDCVSLRHSLLLDWDEGISVKRISLGELPRTTNCVICYRAEFVLRNIMHTIHTCYILWFGTDQFQPCHSGSLHWHWDNRRITLRLPHEPLARYVKLRVAHAPGMPGTFSPPPWVSDPDMHHGTCATHVPWCMPGSLTCDFIWSWWREKRSRHSRRMRNPQFYVSGKRPIASEATAKYMSKWVA